MNIQFDPTNLSADMVGEHGLTRSEIKDHSAKAIDARKGFQKLSDSGKIGFPGLPLESKTAKDILKFAGEVGGSYETVCVVGIGGSALGAWAIDNALRGPHPVQPAFSR